MTENIIETVNRLFIAADNRDWKQVKEVFNDTVFLDYTSMAGGQPATLTADQIIEAWKGLLPGFDKTHHQLGNYLVTTNGNTAQVFCYGTATHYLPNASKHNLWIVVGSYDFALQQVDAKWRITKMKFNLEYIDGNSDLPRLAQERLKQ